MSTQADEVITTHLAVETPVRKGSPRPHLILKEQRMTFDGSGPELTADAVSFDEALLPRAQPHVWQAPARTVARFAPRSRAYLPLKRLLDIVGALAIGLAFSPLLVVIAVRMGLEDGPILFRHRRIGQGGRTFECLKFRTMVPNAEQILHDLLERDPEARAEWLRDHKLRCDPRVTRLGRFLRKTSLDELPQIWNVLRGEMSLVGPRPIVKEEMLRWGHCIGARHSASEIACANASACECRACCAASQRRQESNSPSSGAQSGSIDPHCAWGTDPSGV